MGQLWVKHMNTHSAASWGRCLRTGLVCVLLESADGELAGELIGQGLGDPNGSVRGKRAILGRKFGPVLGEGLAMTSVSGLGKYLVPYSVVNPGICFGTSLVCYLDCR